MRSTYRSARKTLLILTRDRFGADGIDQFAMPERLKMSVVHNLVAFSRLTEVVLLRLTRRRARRS